MTQILDLTGQAVQLTFLVFFVLSRLALSMNFEK